MSASLFDWLRDDEIANVFAKSGSADFLHAIAERRPGLGPRPRRDATGTSIQCYESKSQSNPIEIVPSLDHGPNQGRTGELQRQPDSPRSQCVEGRGRQARATQPAADGRT